MLNTALHGGYLRIRATRASIAWRVGAGALWVGVAVGCAPIVVDERRPVDGGGGGGSTSDASVAATSTSTGVSSCADREVAMNAAIAAAEACDPDAADPSCAPPQTLRDACGCVGSTLASHDSPAALAAAQIAIDAFRDAGCAAPCPTTCAFAYGYCEPQPGGNGRCVQVMGD